MRFNFVCTMITKNCSCLMGQLMPWCELDDLIECLTLNVRNLEIWEFLILAYWLRGFVSHDVITCYVLLVLNLGVFWGLNCASFASRNRGFSWSTTMLDQNTLMLSEISCFKPMLFFWQCELTCILKLNKKMIELVFVVFIKGVSLNVS